jgi:hypothetical protein
MAAVKRYDMEFFKKLYITGELSLKGISAQYGVSYAHISQTSAKETWGKAKTEYILKTKEAEHSAEIKRMDESLIEMKETEPLKADEHQKRAVQTGDKLGTLIQTGIQATKSGDWRTLKSATETWRIWDEQMRKNHGLENDTEKPLVNINVLGALPPKSQMKRKPDPVELEVSNDPDGD